MSNEHEADVIQGSIAGRFEQLQQIGEGGMGRVYRAFDNAMHRAVALKMLRSGVPNTPEVQRFAQEAKVLSSVQHPNIVQVYAVGVEQEPYIVMELVDGESVASLLQRKGTLTLQRTAELVIQIANALDYLHAHGIVHRDLKPTNVMLRPDGSACLLDFGIAKIAGDGLRMTQTGEVIGSPFYISPEQCQGKMTTASSDVYALACMAFEMLTGKPPFGGDTVFDTIRMHLEEDPPKLQDERLNEVFAKACAKAPEQRFASAGEFAQALRQQCGRSVSMLAAEESRSKKPHRKLTNSGRRISVLVLCSLGIIVGVLAAIAWIQRPHDPSATTEHMQGEQTFSAQKTRAYDLLSTGANPSDVIPVLEAALDFGQREKVNREELIAPTITLCQLRRSIAQPGRTDVERLQDAMLTARRTDRYSDLTELTFLLAETLQILEPASAATNQAFRNGLALVESTANPAEAAYFLTCAIERTAEQKGARSAELLALCDKAMPVMRWADKDGTLDRLVLIRFFEVIRKMPDPLPESIRDKSKELIHGRMRRHPEHCVDEHTLTAQIIARSSRREAANYLRAQIDDPKKKLSAIDGAALMHQLIWRYHDQLGEGEALAMAEKACKLIEHEPHATARLVAARVYADELAAVPGRADDARAAFQLASDMAKKGYEKSQSELERLDIKAVHDGIVEDAKRAGVPVKMN